MTTSLCLNSGDGSCHGRTDSTPDPVPSLSEALPRPDRRPLSIQRLDNFRGLAGSPDTKTFSTDVGSALENLLQRCRSQIPDAILSQLKNATFTGDRVFFPCPFRGQEAVCAIKALEGCAVAAIAHLGLDQGDREQKEADGENGQRLITIDADRVAGFLMAAYVVTIDGMSKGHSNMVSKLPKSDLNQAQSIPYRRVSAGLYETKTPGKYYHIHGSLEATTTLAMIGLPPLFPQNDDPDPPAMSFFNYDYDASIATVEAAVRQFTPDELEVLNETYRQAGVPALTADEFAETEHGRLLLALPPFTVTPLETESARVPFPSSLPLVPQTPLDPPAPQALIGIKVLELCRVLAGPVIGRTLAAHGASVLKVTSPNLPDVPFFQFEVNTGKHTTALDLRSEGDRKVFAGLLADADVIIDGYRPGALDRLGFGLDYLSDLAKRRQAARQDGSSGARGKGFVYVVEDCFGGGGHDVNDVIGGDEIKNTAPWSHRPGWQQIADCVTGVAWAQGRFMGLDEPVVPPFPMCDYGTGALGSVAALIGLYKRATCGGSWACRTSLCQYDAYMLSLGLRSATEQAHLRALHEKVGLERHERPERREKASAGPSFPLCHSSTSSSFFALRHHDSVDRICLRATESMRHIHPHLFATKSDGILQSAWSPGFEAVVAWPREAVQIQGLRVGYRRPTRPNGYDAPSWEDWEEVEDME